MIALLVVLHIILVALFIWNMVEGLREKKRLKRIPYPVNPSDPQYVKPYCNSQGKIITRTAMSVIEIPHRGMTIHYYPN